MPPSTLNSIDDGRAETQTGPRIGLLARVGFTIAGLVVYLVLWAIGRLQDRNAARKAKAARLPLEPPELLGREGRPS